MAAKLFLIIGLLLANVSYAAKTGTVDYSRSISASEASEWFFGKSKPREERIKLALNVGRINIRLGTKLKCGKLSLDGNVSGELNRLKSQLDAAAHSLRSMITDSGSVVATVCYFKPNVCAHMRHFSAILQEELNLQLDACRAMDNFINSQAEKGQKELQAKAAQDCINGKSELGPTDMKRCLEQDGKARNLLRPFSNQLAYEKQKVLSSIMQVVAETDDYETWSQLLGEVELHENGYWAKAFPKDLLKPESYVNNVKIASRKLSCDPTRLKNLVQSENPPEGDKFSKYVHKVIKDKISLKTIYNLRSLPIGDRDAACQALGNSIAGLAVKRFNAKGRSNLTAALANDALPDQLLEFYSNRSNMTFAAIESKLAADEIKPVSEIIERIGRLGATYRMKGREDAADITANKLRNKALENECTDAFSCEE